MEKSKQIFWLTQYITSCMTIKKSFKKFFYLPLIRIQVAPIFCFWGYYKKNVISLETPKPYSVLMNAQPFLPPQVHCCLIPECLHSFSTIRGVTNLGHSFVDVTLWMRYRVMWAEQIMSCFKSWNKRGVLQGLTFYLQLQWLLSYWPCFYCLHRAFRTGPMWNFIILW